MQPSDYSMQSAVDLGARKAALDREAKRQAEESSGNANPYAIDITEENFQQEVLERSMNVPVVLAVLQARSEQSGQVEKALDRLAVEAGGQWAVAKVDVQASPQIAQAMRVQSVPTVAMVIGGQVVPGPGGPATYDQLREWLVQVFDGLRQQGILPEEYTGLGEPQEPAEEEQEGGQPQSAADAEAQEALERGDFDAAEAVYSRAVEADPNDEEAKLKLAHIRLVGRVRMLDANERRQTAAENPQDVQAQIDVADIDMYGGKIEDAFDRLISTVRRTAEDDRDRARQHLLSLFEVLPPGDPRVAKARRSLTSALF
ncbi:tetratricopeptide repeat protein [Streptomonospora litoralis]|uniref:Thioredoxin C-1 n=1 Tax=Streptomonospora litoralis TaxID=2498135 RepID=A0A4P6Q2M0_9ACTN|nr:tetratricopeptide repeat protein [Streptomonospora litoralis]QBI52887.1 Thioredoxin C-1 [Streptomonospora litoralis]